MVIQTVASHRAFDAREFYRALGNFGEFYKAARKGLDKTGSFENAIMVLYDPTQQHIVDQIAARNIQGAVPYEQIRNITSRVFYPKTPTERLQGRMYHLLRERKWTMDLADEIEFFNGGRQELRGDSPSEVEVYFFKPKNMIRVPKKDVDFRQRQALRPILEGEHFYHRTLESIAATK